MLFALVLALAFAATRIARLPAGDRTAALFCAPQKTLASGAPLAKLLFASDPAIGLILLPVMFYHPLQLLASGALVHLLKPPPDAAEKSNKPET
jgi:sodium/bile acid cotransporter 7